MKKLTAALLAACSVCVGDENLELLIGPEEIEQQIAQVAQKINADYQGEELAIVMVMKGAICVTADLIRHLEIPFTLDYMRASSYKGGTSSGALTISGLDNLHLDSKHVLVVDDIFDTGKTMQAIVEQLEKKNPKSVKTLVLLLKDVPRKTDYLPDYHMFEIENRFVIGYGLDYKEKSRGLPGIYAFINDSSP